VLASSLEYTPRHPEQSALYRVIAEQLETAHSAYFDYS
jgi:hypothetical protein